MTRARTLLLACVACVTTRSLAAQESPHQRPVLPFLGGAVVAFLSHESGHVIPDLVFHADPHLEGVQFGPIPFFTVAQHNPVTRGQEYAISSGGFWVQETVNEWILSSRPRLRREHAPFLKGMVVFNVLMQAGYSTAAIFRYGPDERDPRSMASSSGLPEPAIGAMILAPAVLDGYRYFHPEKRWAAWASRAVKAGTILLVIRAASR